MSSQQEFELLQAVVRLLGGIEFQLARIATTMEKAVEEASGG